MATYTVNLVKGERLRRKQVTSFLLVSSRYSELSGAEVVQPTG